MSDVDLEHIFLGCKNEIFEGMNLRRPVLLIKWSLQCLNVSYVDLCRSVVCVCCQANVSLLLRMMEPWRCGMSELILVWQLLVVALVQFYAWNMMTLQEYWLLVVEIRMLIHWNYICCVCWFRGWQRYAVNCLKCDMFYTSLLRLYCH